MRTRRSLSLLVLFAAAAALPSCAAAQFLLPQAPRTATLQVQPAKADELLTLANGARAQQGLSALQSDPSLAYAALQHCLRMVSKGLLAHQYEGEADLRQRALDAGAQFTLVEENIGKGPEAAAIHAAWMESPGHRANLLKPEIDHVGIAVVSVGDMVFAVADYARTQAARPPEKVEDLFGALLKKKGLDPAKDNDDAQTYCQLPDDKRGFQGKSEPSFLVKWQNTDTTQLPQMLVDRIATGSYKQYAIATCPPQNVEAQPSVYRVAVLLY